MIEDELDISIIIHTFQDKEYYPIFTNEETRTLEAHCPRSRS